MRRASPARAWTLGGEAGVHTATATVAGLPPVQFTATRTLGSPAAVVVVSGNGQAPAAVAQAQPLGVRVVDAGGNPLAGVPVAWTSAVPGDSFAPNPSTTDSEGIATTDWLPTRVSGSHAVTATAAEGVSATFSLTLTVDESKPAVRLTAVSGDGQTGVRGRPLDGPLVVRVFDSHGNPTPGATVLWSSPGASFAPASSTSDAQGYARTAWTLSTERTGPSHTATAQLPGYEATASFSATGVRPEAASITISQASLTLPCCFDFSPVEADVRDELGNPIPDAPLVWSIDVDSVAAVRGAFMLTTASVKPTFPGTATIMASSGSRSATASLEVTPVSAGPHLQVLNPAYLLQAGGYFVQRDDGGWNPEGGFELRIRNAGGSGTIEGITVEVEYVSGNTGWLETALSGTSAPALLRLSIAPGAQVTQRSVARLTVRSTTPGTTAVTLRFEASP